MGSSLSTSHGRYRLGEAELFLCAAPSRADLVARLRKAKSRIEGGSTDTSVPSFSPGLTHRFAMVSRSPGDLVARLSVAIERLASDAARLGLGQDGIYANTADFEGLRKTAFVFPGLGVPTEAMLRELCERFPIVRDWYREIEASDLSYYRQRIPILPEDEIVNDLDTPGDDEMRQFDAMQQMLMANMGAFILLQHVGLGADAMIGHSHGEHSLLWASGMVKSPAQMFYLLRRIVRATVACSGEGSLATLAVTTTTRFTVDDLARASGPGVLVALDNCPGQRVICGPPDEIATVAETVRSRGGICFAMPGLGQPVHTPAFPVSERRLRKIYGEITLDNAETTGYSCTSAAPFPADAAEARELLVQQWLTTVRFRETVQRLYDDGVRTFLEVGPGGKVTGFIRDTLRNTDAVAFALHQEGRSTGQQLLLTFANLFVRGHEMDLSVLNSVAGAADESSAPSAVLRLQSTPVLDVVMRHLAALLDAGEEMDARRGFFEMGLTSLGAVELAARLGQEFDLALPDTAAFDHPSPESLAASIERELKPIASKAEGTPVVERGPTEADDIAIVGIGVRLPGGANSPKEFWELLRDGRDAVGEVPDGRWDVEEDWDVAVRSGGFLDDVAGFDAGFFGISPREAETLDPQQRLLLEVSWEALENAGVNPHALRGSRTGVFYGLSSNDYANRLSSEQRLAINGYIGTGNAASVAAGRVSFLLGLHGPSFTVDTACSSSLVAVHLACQSLHSRESEMTIAGGVNLILSPETSLYLKYGHALSDTGRCRTFDEGADGYIRGEGCGAVVLKRMKDAVASGDRVYAVIRGSAVNHDGHSSGLTVPNGHAQEALLRSALQAAGIDARDVDYVEAHGTGTPLGDPIEVRALSAVYCEGRPPENPLRLGSVKTNVGHLEAAAGVTALIKTALQLYEKMLAPSLHFAKPNPRIDWERSPLEVCVKASAWDGRDRIAGVSSFGMSGTNAHLILQSAPETLSKESSPQSHVLTISAQTEAALERLAAAYASSDALLNDDLLAAACFTANTGRAHFRYRRAVVADSVERMRDLLKQPSQPSKGRRPKLAFLFSGQGSQTLSMGKQMFAESPVFREAIRECDEILTRECAIPLLKLLFESSAEMVQTAALQPALFAVEYALAQTWRSWGIVPDYVAGHSLGEYAAACFAGVVPLRSALLMVAARANCMDRAGAGGAMLAVRASEQRVRQLLEIDDQTLSLAAVNSPQSVVVSGLAAYLDEAEQLLQADGIACIRLNVSHAFHSSQMDRAADEFAREIADSNFMSPQIPWVSSVSGGLADGETLTPAYWSEQIRKTVRFGDTMQTLASLGVEAFVEVGPRPVLLGLGRETVSDADRLWLASLNPPREEYGQMLSSLARLYEAGYDIDFKGIYGDQRYAAVDLPTYPFERTRYWMSAPVDVARASTVSRRSYADSLLGERIDLPGCREVRFESSIACAAVKHDYRVFGRSCLPISSALFMAHAAAVDSRDERVLLTDIDLGAAISLEGEDTLVLHTAIAPGEDGSKKFATYRREGEIWREIASFGITQGTSFSQTKITPPNLPEASLERFYEASAKLGFEYGESLRVLEELRVAQGLAAGTISATAANQRFAVEGCFQLLAAALYSLADAEAMVYEPKTIRLANLPALLPERFIVIARCNKHEHGMVGGLMLLSMDSHLIGEISDVLYVPMTRPETTQGSHAVWIAEDEVAQPGLILENLQGILCGILRCTRSAVANVDEPFQRLGMDSLMAMEFSNTLQHELGIRLPVYHFFGDSSLSTLSAEVMRQLREISVPDESTDWVEGVL